MESIETIYATAIPTRRVAIFSIVISSKFVIILRKLTPTITGIARKNENSAATPREQPRIIAPKIVEPERDVPGIIESTWKSPIISAVL